MMIGIYVDDCLVLAEERNTKQIIVDLKLKGFYLKAEKYLKHYFVVVELWKVSRNEKFQYFDLT